MSKNGSTKKINPIWVVLAIILAVGALFCLTTYIYGKCTNQTFVEVLTNKTETTEDKTEDKGDESEPTDENQGAVEDEQSNVQTTSYLNLEDNIIFIQQ